MEVDVDATYDGHTPTDFDVTVRLPAELDEEQREPSAGRRLEMPRAPGADRRDDGDDLRSGRGPLMDLGLAGRTCAVTGASRGIGRETARMLCEEGANVLLIARGEERPRRGDRGGRGRRRRRRAAGPQHVALDVTARGRRRPHARRRRAGLRRPRRARQQRRRRRLARPRRGRPTAEWRAAYELNVMAPLRLMRAAIPPMEARGWGRVVNVCSTAGKRPSAAMPEYSVAKAAELSLSRLFADRHAAERRARQRDLPRAGRIGDVDGARRPARPVAASFRAVRAGRRLSRPPARSARSAGSPSPARSPPRSSSSARSAPPTSPAPPGPWTAAPSR